MFEKDWLAVFEPRVGLTHSGLDSDKSVHRRGQWGGVNNGSVVIASLTDDDEGHCRAVSNVAASLPSSPADTRMLLTHSSKVVSWLKSRTG